jgi:hypothetical protein
VCIPAVVAALVAVLVAVLGAVTAVSAQGRHSAPVMFDSEIIRLYVERDTLEVEGIYLLLCNPESIPEVTLFYPYPARDYLGEAHTVLLEARPPGGQWRTLRFVEHPVPRSLPTGEMSGGARWWVPLTMGDSLEVRTVYRQAVRGDCATYIVRTTRAWGRPLENARFEIHLAQGLSPVSFSFPFRNVATPQGTYYLYEASNFSPDSDIDVCWNEESVE